MNGHRKIWTRINGTIPKDENGRSYEIHHLDGNHKNNKPDNLMCVSIVNHYQVHFAQKDWGACAQIARRMGVEPKEVSRLASLANKARLEKGDHPFLNKNVRAKALEGVKKRVKMGIQGLQVEENMQKAINATKARSTESCVKSTKLGWKRYKEKNCDSNVLSRTVKGSKVGADKTRGTKWFHKEDGSQIRVDPSQVDLDGNWIKGRFNGKELSRIANKGRKHNV